MWHKCESDKLRQTKDQTVLCPEFVFYLHNWIVCPTTHWPYMVLVGVDHYYLTLTTVDLPTEQRIFSGVCSCHAYCLWDTHFVSFLSRKYICNETFFSFLYYTSYVQTVAQSTNATRWPKKVTTFGCWRYNFHLGLSVVPDRLCLGWQSKFHPIVYGQPKCFGLQCVEGRRFCFQCCLRLWVNYAGFRMCADSKNPMFSCFGHLQIASRLCNGGIWTKHLDSQ